MKRHLVPGPSGMPARASGGQALRRACTALALTVALGTGAGMPSVRAQSSLPALGDASSRDLPPAAERQLGDRIMREVWRDPAYLHDAVLHDYLQGIWQPLLEGARLRGELSADLDELYAWQVFQIRDRSVNAFALPGGYIGVHLGLLAVTGTRDELASVLAHELAHVTQRHIARSIAEQRHQSLVAMAAMILGAIAVSRSPGAGEALVAGGQAAAIAGQLAFSRDMEREADRVGFGVLTQAGFDPAGMAGMFDRLALAARLNDTGAFPYLRTHPLTVERVGEAQSRLGLPAAGSGAPAASRMLHATMQARARVLMVRSSDVQQGWGAGEDEPATGTRHDADAADRLWQAYGSAFSAALARDWARAEAALARAREHAAADAAAMRSVELLAVDIALRRGEAAAALATLARLERDGATDGGVGSSRTLLLMTAEAVLRPDAPADARLRAAERLQTWAVSHPQDAPVWQALSLVWREAGQPLRSLRAQAESHLALGDASGAVDRLRAAQRQARSGAATDFVEASVIDARLRQAEALLREQQEAERARGG